MWQSGAEGHARKYSTKEREILLAHSKRAIAATVRALTRTACAGDIHLLESTAGATGARGRGRGRGAIGSGLAHKVRSDKTDCASIGFSLKGDFISCGGLLTILTAGSPL